MLKGFEILNKKYNDYENYLQSLEKKVREVCSFNARITYCSGDGHLILNEETSSVARISCLIGRTIENKLDEEEHDRFCI